MTLAVLSIAAAGILQLHTAVVTGLRSSETISVAMDIARARSEEYAGRGSAGIAGGATGCSYSVPALHQRLGCANSNFTAFQAPTVAATGIEGCTDQVNGADVGETTVTTDIDAGARYRVDTVTLDNPTTTDPDDLIVLVSVCWQDGSRVREVQIRRVATGA